MATQLIVPDLIIYLPFTFGNTTVNDLPSVLVMQRATTGLTSGYLASNDWGHLTDDPTSTMGASFHEKKQTWMDFNTKNSMECP